MTDPHRHSSDRGSIPLALLIVIACSALMLVLVSRTLSAQNQVTFDREFTNALPVADAGLEIGLFELNADATFTSAADGIDYPRRDFPIGDTTIVYSDTLGGHTYAWSAARNSQNDWTVTSASNVDGTERVVVGDFQEQPLIFLSAFSDRLLLFRGGNAADSYNSGTGATCTGNGTIASNDDVTFNGSSTTGTVCPRPGGRSVDGVELYDWAANPGTGATSARPGGSRCDNGGSHANCIELAPSFGQTWPAALPIDERLDLATDDAIAFIADTIAACEAAGPLDDFQSSTDGAVLTPAPNASDAAASGNMALAGGHYCFDSMDFDQNTTLAPSASSSNPVIIFVKEAVTLLGRGRNAVDVNCVDCDSVSYATPEAGALRIFVLEGGISLGNQAQFAGILYGPRADCGGVNSNAQADIYGSLVCASLANNGGWAFHYDDTLGNLGNGEFVLSSWREEVPTP